MEISKRVIELRRELHKLAELSFEELKTSAFLRELFESHGLTVQGCAGTGLIITLGKEKKTQALMLRADMDALPIHEKTDVPYRSNNPGVMHACGHDAHMSILATTLLWSLDYLKDFQRPLKFVFQPAEEKGGGAKAMVEEGVLRDPEVSEVYGLHIANRLPTNVIGVKTGIASSFCDEFRIHIKGKGGHGARPYQCVEPIVLGSKIVLESQAIIAREMNALKSAVLTFTTFHSGTCFNVIADTCDLGGTLRTLSIEDRSFIVSRLEKKFRAMEQEFGADIEFELIEGYPAIQNDETACALIREITRCELGESYLLDEGLGVGGEDVAYFLQEVPGCYFLLGCGGSDLTFAPHHSPLFNFDESALQTGVKIFQKIIERRVLQPI